MEGGPGAVMRLFKSFPTQSVLWFHELSGSLAMPSPKVFPFIPQSSPFPNSKNYYWDTKIGFLSNQLQKTLNNSFCFAPWLTVIKNRLDTFGLNRNKQISLRISQSMRVVQLSKELAIRYLEGFGEALQSQCDWSWSQRDL